MQTESRRSAGGRDLDDLTRILKLMRFAARPSRRGAGGANRTPESGGEDGNGATQAADGQEQAARRPGRRSWPGSEETKQLQAELDDIGLAFRLCGSKVQRPDGWMRAVRQAIGVPVVELARRMGVRKTQIFRLEESERDGRVRMATLRRAATAMGCELVYALIPSQGKLASMAAARRTEDEARRKRAAAERKAQRKDERRARERAPRRGETIREEAERLGIAAEFYGK